MSVCHRGTLCLSAAASTPLPDNSQCISDNNQPTVGILAAHLAYKQLLKKKKKPSTKFMPSTLDWSAALGWDVSTPSWVECQIKRKHTSNYTNAKINSQSTQYSEFIMGWLWPQVNVKCTADSPLNDNRASSQLWQKYRSGPICSLPLAHNCRYIKRQPSAPCHICLTRSKLEAAPGHLEPHVSHSSL